MIDASVRDLQEPVYLWKLRKRSEPGSDFGNVASMIYLGTDSGLYRWTSHATWPTFHSLQGARIRTVIDYVREQFRQDEREWFSTTPRSRSMAAA